MVHRALIERVALYLISKGKCWLLYFLSVSLFSFSASNVLKLVSQSMGALLFCRVRLLGFCLNILLGLSLCYGNHVTVGVEGYIECAHCIPGGVTASETSSGTGPRMSIDCKSTGGDLRRMGTGEVDDRGNFKIKFLQDKIFEDQVERGTCFLKLDGGSSAPCPGQKVQNVLVTIFKSVDNVKQTSAMIKKLKFSSITCAPTILWPYDKKKELLKHILPSPGKSVEYPHQPSVKAFLSPKASPLEALPPYAKTFSRSLSPPASTKKYSKSISVLMSRKLLTLPLHFFPPLFPPFPVIQYPCPVLAPPVGNPIRVPTTKKPLPPPTPTSYKSPPTPTAVSTKPLSPPAPILKKPVLAPPPMSRMPAAPIVPSPKKPPPPSRPNLKKPLSPVPPPMPHSNKPPPAPPKQPNAPLHPPISPKPKIPAAPLRRPISPTPMSHPSPEPAHKSAPSPLPIINPTPPTKKPPSPAAPQRKSFSPIPKAPPIPKLPPTPIVPRRYFNSPNSAHQPPSPPS